MKFPFSFDQRRSHKAFSVIVALLLIGSVSYLGVRYLNSSKALVGGPKLLMSPATSTAVTGATIPVQIRINSGTTRLTVVRAHITYPASQLELTSITNSSTYPLVMRETKTSGNIDVIRSISGGSQGPTGDSLIVTVNFKVIGTSGTIPVTFNSTSEAYDDTGSGTNIIDYAASTGATYSFADAASTPLYRLANFKTRERLFTTSWPEVVAAQQNNSGWVYENVAMRIYGSPAGDRTTVYRLANFQTKERLFTTDANERNAIRGKNGWIDEGVGFYGSNNTANMPVYRMANFITKERLFTTDANERNTIRDKNGWVYEGIAFYAAP